MSFCGDGVNQDMKIPERGPTVMMNQGNFDSWDANIKSYIRSVQVSNSFVNKFNSVPSVKVCQVSSYCHLIVVQVENCRLAGGCNSVGRTTQEDGASTTQKSTIHGRQRSFKYSGAFVGDVHFLLTQGGGIFG